VGELAPLLGGTGVFGVLALVIGYLLKYNRDDRIQLGKEIDDAEARADKAETRAERLQVLLDAANEERRKALDVAAEQARAAAARAEEVAREREKVDRQAAELAKLREQPP
jgi:predicted Zn-dependent peptidase